MVTLYSTHCPNCNALESLLKAKNIEYEIVDDKDKIVEVGRACNILSAPILVVEDKPYKFIDAVKWVKSKRKDVEG